MERLVAKLDLKEYIESFLELMARSKPLYMEGDVNVHYQYVSELEHYDFKAPSKVRSLQTSLMLIKKQGVLGLDEIFEFVKIIRYFVYLKHLKFEGRIGEWLEKIEIPGEIWEVSGYFDEKGAIKESVDERLLSLGMALKKNKEEIRTRLHALVNSPKLAPYLVDRQIHLINQEESLLVRGGFNHLLKASVIGRSSGGFFYIIPDVIYQLKEREASILSKREEVFYEYAKKISSLFVRHQKFLAFIDREFDRFDHYQARVFFAKSRDLEFVLPRRDDKIVLKDFVHPALANPRPVTVDFSKKILMITGVNAGGKTMLLKSILSAAFLAKYLLPMKLNREGSRIGSFKEIVPIIEDPQNVRNDISTFAGRMVEFSKLFTKNDALVGVDEIELGTDSDEAASLFKVILEQMMARGIKTVITTHHKRLATLMAANEEVELVAALYDEKNQLPTYNFLQGIIGKSYAFETARRYGIPIFVVQKAKEEYGADQEKLGELIERSSELERELRRKSQELDDELARVKKSRLALEAKQEEFEQRLRVEKARFEKIYTEAADEARKALKAKEAPEAHRHLTQAHKIAQQAKTPPPELVLEFVVGQSVRYRKKEGLILSIKEKEAMIEVDGVRLRVPISELRTCQGGPRPKPPAPKVHVQKPEGANVTLDLHGLRVEEALERLDKFLSDALLAGFDEVLVYHGVGTGKLAFAVREFLKKHPRVKSFGDALPQMGGFGATLVML